MEPNTVHLIPDTSTKSPQEQASTVVLKNSSAGPKFPLGSIVITPTAAEIVPPGEMYAALARHSRGDWGNVGKNDWKENDLSLTLECRILSAYSTQKGEKFWIITEADRSYTTILLPSDY